MKKYLWVLALALVISSLSAGSVSADSSHQQQDQAFLSSLAHQALLSPAAPVPAAAPPPELAPPASCVNLACEKDSDCWPYCGGEGSSYCSWGAYKRCVPY